MIKNLDEIKNAVLAEIDQNKNHFFEINKTLYENPEIGYEEFMASAILTSELEKCGFDVAKGIAGMETAFCATLEGKSSGSTAAILAEYDALPGVGHGCGHNIIGTSAVAAAYGLSKVLKKLPGRLMVVGTPNEEGGSKGGKILEVEAGVFNDVDAVMMIHPTRSARAGAIVHPRLTRVEASSLALAAIEIRFKGKATHASSAPELGVNALDAVIQTFNGLNALRQHIRSDARIHGIITDGGKAPNVVPEEAAAYFYVRAPETEYMWEMMKKLRHCAEGAAIATGATVELNQDPHHMEPVKLNLTLARLLEKNLMALGERVGEREKKRMGKGSTDFGNVSQRVPGAHSYIAIGQEEMSGHSKEFAEASISEAGRRGLLVAAKAMALSCIDLFSDQKLLKEVKEEFQGKALR